jgi:hypothetical protein
MYLPCYPLSVREGKVLQHMFAENAIERLVWERERLAEINPIMDVVIPKPVDIHPMIIVNAAGAGAEV